MNPISDSVTAMDAELQATKLDNEELRTRNAVLEAQNARLLEIIGEAAPVLSEWLEQFDRTRLGERVRTSRALLGRMAGEESE